MTTTIPEPVGLLANSADQLPSNGHEQSVCDRSHPPVSLKRNAAWVLAGNGTYAACQWMQVAVLAHAGTSRDVGRYALAFAIATPIFMLANLQLRSIQATDTARRYTLGHYVALRLVTCFLGLLAVLLIACLYSRSYEIALVTVL
ncbi:MAG: hypothetical protein JO108_00145, partial [Acidobacteriaceae bacterium]|nr:hypothetical protein [Acidobacteriaceae bacterium]